MRKVFANKWFILASLLAISLSTFSFIMYPKGKSCARHIQNTCKSGDSGEIIWDVLIRRLPLVSVQ